LKTWVYAVLVLGACSRQPRVASEELARAALATYAQIAEASAHDALTGARGLDAAVAAFVAAPGEEGLAAARAAWRAARRPYLQTEVFRFYEGPIDRVELLVNTWPIDESYVERVIEDPTQYPTLDKALLVSLNASAGETSISTGWHVIEFLLWGRDRRADGPGARAASEFVGEGVPARRRTYLRQASALLVEHLAQVHAAWSGPYRSEFAALPVKQALGRVLRGMGSLSGPELAGERLTVPYETRDQENEHSCFSDTTHEDVLYDAQGVLNLCLGRYQAIQGVGICQLVADLDVELGQQLKQQIAASVAAAARIPAPFDQALGGADDAPGRVAIKSTIDALQAQTETLTRVAARVGT
jgi:putative iron-regulated protein